MMRNLLNNVRDKVYLNLKLNIEKENKSGFTLAEVLITLGIIGVVAALTLPLLVQSYKDRAIISGLAKTYSTLAQAQQYVIQNEGDFNNYVTTGEEKGFQAKQLINIYAKYIRNLKICEIETGCWPDLKYRSLSGYNGTNINTSSTYGKAIINDGVLLYMYILSSKCDNVRGTTPELQTVCATATVDINGFKQPNQFGRDTFSFYITKDKVIPQGLNGDTEMPFPGKCNYLGDSTGNNGIGCTAWLLHNKDFEYRKCNDLSWSGKSTCK